jgi:cytochrome P450
MKYSIYAFGGGSRVCMGRHLARMELRMAVYAFVRTFEDAELAYGVDGFSPQGMDIVETIVAKPVAEKMLVR